jgi:hypothetical protein
MSEPTLTLVSGEGRPYRCEVHQAREHGCADVENSGCTVLNRRRLVRRLVETIHALAEDSTNEEPLGAHLVEDLTWKAIRLLDAIEESVGQPEEGGQ